MSKAELEYTAAYLIRALVVLGDEWKPVALKTVADVARVDMEAQRVPMRHWANPFVKPSPTLLVDRGFAIFGESGEGETIALTEQGLQALRKYVTAR